jgi:hypothetical protein
MANLASIKTNILLTAIIVPLAILIVVFIIVSVWFWNDKFSENKPKKFEPKNADPIKTLNETIYGNDKGHIKNKNEMHFRRLSFCKCYKKFSSFNFSQKEKSYREKIMKSCVGAKSADRVRINSITSNTQTENHPNKPKRDINFIDLMPINYINAGAQSNQTNNQKVATDEIEEKVDMDTLTSTAMGIDECQIASESQLTLASHFEENNWDYNFATRGLYLNQPWDKGRYGKHFEGSEHSVASDTFSTSKCGVLTLEAVKDDYTCTTNDATKIIGNDIGEGDETDGYYA